jgi:hypothetical protein
VPYGFEEPFHFSVSISISQVVELQMLSRIKDKSRLASKSLKTQVVKFLHTPISSFVGFVDRLKEHRPSTLFELHKAKLN